MAETPELQGQGAPAASQEQVTEFQSLLRGGLKGTTDQAQEMVITAVSTLAEWALRDTALVSEDALRTINQIKSEIDKKLSAQINLILHHEELQRLEGSWRGLYHLVSHTETGTDLKIRVMNVSKNDLGKTLKKFEGTNWDQSPLFKQIYEQEYGQFGGEPYGALIGDYHFDHTGPDVKMLELMGQVAAAAHAPFIAGASPSLFQMSSYRELANPRDLAKIFTTPDYAAWRSLRQSDDARYLALTMPRFLARPPYGAKTNPVEEFDFEEDTSGGAHDRYTWANSAYAMAVNINTAYKADGWLARIRGVESGGLVEGLPVHTFPSDDGGVDMKCPTEIAISDRREAELSGLGFLALLHRKNSDVAAFIGGQTLQEPAKYSDPDDQANANLSARLPYIFACCRFAHYLKAMVRDKVGSFKTREAMQDFLQNWLYQYVDGDPKNSTDETKARKPLAGAKVEVTEDEGNPGYYSAKFFLMPHYQLEGLTASLRLVGRLPAE